MVVFEGVGVGLLVPLLSLLLGGTNAVPMRPIQWLQSAFPNHSPAFLRRRSAAWRSSWRSARRTSPPTSPLLFSARLKRRVATSLRGALFASLQRANLDIFDQRPGGEFANIFLVETYRTTVAIEAAVGFAQRAGIALFYVGALFYISWQLTWLVVAARPRDRRLARVHLSPPRPGGHEAHRPEPPAVGGARAVVRRGPRGARHQRAAARRSSASDEVNNAQAASDEETTRASLLFPLVETLGVIGAMVIVACAYIFFVRPGHMLSSYLLGYGFVLLRLLPLLNTLTACRAACSTSPAASAKWSAS